MLYVCNAFSLQMLEVKEQRLRVEPLEPAFARLYLLGGSTFPPSSRPLLCGGGPSWRSAVGHADIAAVMSKQLGIEIPYRPDRPSVKIGPGDAALVGQYIGPRLAEGATSLPDGAAIQWWLVEPAAHFDEEAP